MDLKTFFTELSMMVDAWYKEYIAGGIYRQAGPAQQGSDSEVLRQWGQAKRRPYLTDQGFNSHRGELSVEDGLKKAADEMRRKLNKG